jgi:hypothetical protein
MRRSSLYLALVRFVTVVLQFASYKVPGTAPLDLQVQRDHRFTGHTGSIAKART